jgi:hypothetical protein
MKNRISYIVDDQGNIHAYYDGKNYSIPKDHENYENILRSISNQDISKFLRYIDTINIVNNYLKGKVEIINGNVYYAGKVIHNNISKRILDFLEKKLNPEPIVKFLENLMQNPSEDSKNELYDFLQHKYLPLTEDGYFLAYKRVRKDYYDFHTGTILNKVGSTVSVERNTVDPNRRRDCSHGLHVGAISYVRGFNSNEGVVLVVKVNPKDVVSVPISDTSKMRVCEYFILSEIEDPEQKQLESPCYQKNGAEYDEKDKFLEYNDSINKFYEQTVEIFQGDEDLKLLDNVNQWAINIGLDVNLIYCARHIIYEKNVSKLISYLLDNISSLTTREEVIREKNKLNSIINN